MKKFYPLTLFLLLTALLLAACGGTSSEEPVADTTSADEPSAAEEPSTAAEPTAEPEEEPTAVPTTEPTQEPTAVPTEEPMAEAPTSNLTDGCVENYDETVDYFPEKTAVSYADGFTVDYFNNYKVVTVAAPWLGAEDSATYVLVQCGTPNPSGFDDAVMFDVPITSFVSMSTTYLPHLDQLGRLDSLVGVDFASYAYNATVQEKYAAGELVELGSGATVDVEAALALEPHIIMTSASGSADFDTHPKLQEVGLTVMLNADYLDVTPLGRAEWGKFIAVLYNQEADINAWFDGVAAEYEALTALTADVAERPSVFTNTPFEGTWYMPGGQSYTALLLQNAGANYLWGTDESSGTLFLDFESVFDQAADGTYWINLGFVSSLADLEVADERFADFAAFQNGTVYNYDLRTNEFGGNDFFESAAANPQLVLADLIKIFHPELLPDHEFVYYRLVE
ncbi:ABC transporter substrate-binding protein [Candidatus Leptofilum sp.]|uniref:ABC transporter substrate-binding protein n=1 Tax=Candidatus Leptofilum sp. TaxID=3241576 RepID=UPI003B5C41E8